MLLAVGLPHMTLILLRYVSTIVIRTCSVLCLVAQLCPSLCDLMDCNLPGSSVHGVSLGKNTGVGCHVLLQWIFPTQGSNPSLPHCRLDSLLTEPLGKPNQSIDLLISYRARSTQISPQDPLLISRAYQERCCLTCVDCVLG